MNPRCCFVTAVTGLLLASTLVAQVSPTSTPQNPTDTGKVVKLDEVVVTGVFTETSVQKATVSVTALDQNMLNVQVPVSGVDLLLNVPGVFVNSSLGEIRNM